MSMASVVGPCSLAPFAIAPGYLFLMDVRELLERARDALSGRAFDRELVGRRVIDTGAQADRARELARRLNRARGGPAKQALVLWTDEYSAITRRGPWVYVALGLAQRLSDDGLAFVLAHEMAHHDLGHMSTALGMAAMMGWSPRIELQADRYALSLMRRADFDASAALETFEPSLWEGEDQSAPRGQRGWHRAPGQWVARLRQTHPSLPERTQAIDEWLAAHPV